MNKLDLRQARLPQIQQEKSKLEIQIGNILAEFEDLTGLKVDSLQIERGGVAKAAIGSVPSITSIKIIVKL